MDKLTFVYNKDTYNAYDAQRIVFEAGKFKSEIILRTEPNAEMQKALSDCCP